MEEKLTLSEYCPNQRFQYESTCYAYAVVYTALSTEYNIINNITDKKIINSKAGYFSAGVVASYHNSSLPLLNRSPYCGRYGTADIALKILKDIGTVFAGQYDCDCERYSKVSKKIQNLKKYKISDYQTLSIKNTYDDTHVDWIINALNNNHPVIIAFYQNEKIRGLIKQNEINDLQLDDQTRKNAIKKGSNHVICILDFNNSYKDGNGYFLIKNNFPGWGNDGTGFAWIPYTYLIPLIYEAYYITGIVMP
jgi:hypothetical protein